MSLSHVLQMSFWLAGVCYTGADPLHVPVGQVSVLSKGLLHLLSGKQEDARAVERQRSRVTRALAIHTQQLVWFLTQGAVVSRMVARLKRDLQVSVAHREHFETRNQELHKRLDSTEAEEKDLTHRLTRLEQVVGLVQEPGTKEDKPLNIAQLKVLIDFQSRRLTELMSEVEMQGKLTNRQKHQIEDLDEQVFDTNLTRADELF